MPTSWRSTMTWEAEFLRTLSMATTAACSLTARRDRVIKVFFCFLVVFFSEKKITKKFFALLLIKPWWIIYSFLKIQENLTVYQATVLIKALCLKFVTIYSSRSQPSLQLTRTTSSRSHSQWLKSIMSRWKTCSVWRVFMQQRAFPYTNDPAKDSTVSTHWIGLL